MRRQRGESLSERLRSEVQVSAALWKIGPSADENAARGDAKASDRRHPPAYANVEKSQECFPCPREVKPLLFFYKYLQPIGGAEGDGAANDNNGNPPTNTCSQRKLHVNLPMTVVCERTNAQEMVLWLRTDARGNVIREEKAPLWRKKLHNDLMGVTTGSSASPPGSQDTDPVLAVRSVARWKNSNHSSGGNSRGGSAVVLTRRTLDPVLAVPCELPICIQQFVHCRGSQPSVYRIFWCEQERKCFAVNLTSSLKSIEASEDVESMNHPSAPTSSNGLSGSTMAAVNAAFESAMLTAAQTARFYCVTVSPDARACARWPKLRGAAITEGVQATSRVVEHVQLQLPALRFRSMTVDFIKDTSGVWWLTRVVDFEASSSVEPLRDDGCFSTRDSAVLIPDALRIKQGRPNNDPQFDGPDSPLRESTLLRGDELKNALNARICFLCGCSCELTPTFRGQLEAMVRGQSGDEYKESSTIPMVAPASDQFRMTLTMALDTIFLMRQRGVGLSVWENAVSTVQKSQLRDVCDFPTCMLCYRIYQQQNRLQLLARELHDVLSPDAARTTDRPEEDGEAVSASATDGVGMATSAAARLAASQLLSTELRYRQETPKSVLDSLETFRTETIPPSLLLRGDSPEMRPTWSTLTATRGSDVDPTVTQLRLVFFFHELQDGGQDLVPTDFYLEYQLGQNVTRVQLEGSKKHTPNRWQLCEARVHYLFATLDAFSEFCSHKRLLIKMKAKPRSRSDDPDSDMSGLQDHTSVGNEEDDEQSGVAHNGNPTGDPNHKEEFFGYTLLSLRSVNTAAKWFGNSLQPESRTDYLLELHTASHGLLTLKLTVGLLVDPVPLGHVRDVLRDRVFLEEQPPQGIYWPPPSHCLSGLAVPRDWVGALMPSEYTKMLPRRRREAYGTRGAHAVIALSPSPTPVAAPTTLTPHPGTRSLTPGNTADLKGTAAGATSSSSNVEPHRGSITRRTSTVATGKNGAETERGLSSARGTIQGDDDLGVVNTDQDQPEYRSGSLHLMAVAMIGTTLARACLAAKRIVSRVTEDAATSNFPTELLAAILRHASFANPVTPSCFPSQLTSLSRWKSPARFQFTRRYSVDRLLAEVKPGSLPMLALLGELLLVLIENRELPATVDVSALESLLEPFWQQDSGWRPIPRTGSGCLPERRVIWNRAIRRWEAATGDATLIDEAPQAAAQASGSMKLIVQHHGVTLTTDIGDYRAKTLALVLCELFEQMETLDNGYIEVAELRSLAKCLPEQEYLCAQGQFDPDVGTRERLTQEDIVALGELVDQQRRLALRTLLHSLVGSAVMADALARFDRVGSGEMSLEEFRELAFEALLVQRKVLRAFQEEPKKSHDGFCLRHGIAEIYATDSVCVLCATEYQAENPPPKMSKAPEHQPVVTDSNSTVEGVQVARDAARVERAPSGRSSYVGFDAEERQNVDLANSRRCSSPPLLERPRRLSSGTTVHEEVSAEADITEGLRRRRAITGSAAMPQQVVDADLENMLNRLHTAERTIMTGEAQASERLASVAALRTRQACVSTTTEGASTSSCSDLGGVAGNPRRALSTRTRGTCHDDASAGPDEAAKKKKKRMKKRILAKTARRLRSTNALPASASLSKLLRVELSDQSRSLATSASETIIEKAVRIEEKRKELDRLVLAEVREVKQRLAKLLETCVE
ncbi:Peroxisomal membrane protein PMP27 [Phytophthora pseudosyringae]|uniref:Peroxisomal membrane protein PMP27 n=1 Tax=Phytophthora pseudosyringae TaxID=221518 RepID=A0A8T1VSQ9_9STRA|nr:Peroxisomal membrane protein PMP27 [Phytophthora pseudosyringae]